MSDGRLAVWEPLTINGDTPTGDVTGEFGVVARPDGADHVTLDGSPLYTFSEDSFGQINGDGLADRFDGQTLTWHVVATETTSSWKRIRTALPDLLCDLENRRVDNVRRDFDLQRVDPELDDKLERLGIDAVFCYRPQGSGRSSRPWTALGAAAGRASSHGSETSLGTIDQMSSGS